MKLWFLGLFTAGLALAIGLIVWGGFDSVLDMLATGGLSLFWLGLFYVIPIVFAALSWGRLFDVGAAPRFWPLSRATWIGLSVNWLLPVAQIGGELVKARLAIRHGTTGPVAGASVVADKTLQAFTQLVYTLIGLAMLVILTGGREFLMPVLGTAALFAVGIYIFFRLQNAGLFGALVRIGERLGRIGGAVSKLGGAQALDAELRATYRRRGRLFQAVCLRMTFRFAMAGEVWLALHLLGHPVTIAEAIILESLGQAIRAAAFAVPAGIGVQEGGFVVLGMALGFGPEVGLALSLAKRFRELLVGVSGLLVWHLMEGHDFLRRWRQDRAAPVEEPEA